MSGPLRGGVAEVALDSSWNRLGRFEDGEGSACSTEGGSAVPVEAAVLGDVGAGALGLSEAGIVRSVFRLCVPGDSGEVLERDLEPEGLTERAFFNIVSKKGSRCDVASSVREGVRGRFTRRMREVLVLYRIEGELCSRVCWPGG